MSDIRKPSRRNPHKPQPKDTAVTCETCGVVFMAYSAEIRRRGVRFCSHKCANGVPEQRFWKNTDQNGPIPEHVPELGPCWTWNGSRERSGHGRLFIGKRQREGAHRYAYLLLVGPIPDDLFVCHKCDNPSCVNPKHLFLGTPLDNMRDRNAKDRHCRGSRSPHTKLTDADALEIRRLYAEGELSQDKLAKRFGSAQAVISRIVRRQSWKHI